MEDAKNQPVLICVKKLKPEFCEVQRIEISSDNFSLGRGLTNSVVIPFISISRNHCIFKLKGNSWSIEDNSTFGIKINNKFLGKGSSVTLSDGDILTLDQTCEFVYKFSYPKENEYEVPCKRMKIEDTSHNNVINSTNDIVNSVKIKFEESQNKEIEHIEQKLKNVKQMQTTSMKLHKQLNYEMDQRIERLQNDYTSQIDNLQGEKNEIERQKALLEEERDAQLATIKSQMEQRILKLTVQVRKHNETELELLKENSLLKEKLDKERQEFLAELSRENSSKQDLLEKLEARIKEQEEIRLKDRQEALELHHQELEKLKYAKEMQIKEIEEQKTLQEIELRKELDSIRDKLQEKVVQTEQEKLKAEQQLTEQMEKMKRFNDEDKMKIEKLMKEREEIQSKLTEAQDSAAKTLEELKSRVSERETELAALAAERIQQQQEQSSEVISTLQQQLEKVKNQLEAVESEKKSMLQNLHQDAGPSKQSVLSELGDIVESELQCSICAELFVTPITLGCSHTFCHYCITMWKKKKMDCPICRARIASECKSLVLDTFIEKMVQSLSEEMKEKRKEILKNRKAEVVSMSQATSRTSTRQRRSGRRSSGRRTSRTIPTSTTTTENFLLPMIPIINLTTDELTYRQMEPINLTYPTRTGIDPYTAELVALEETLQRNLLNLGPEDVL